MDDRQTENPGGLLIKAAEGRDAEQIRRLIAAGADINTRKTDDFYHMTPLQLTALHGYSECLSVLIEAGADVNARDTSGGTALHHAVTGYSLGSPKNPNIMALLLEAGVDVNIKNNKGASALHYAVGPMGCSRLIPLLTAAGADTDIRDNIGRTPLHWAAQYKQIRCMKLLIRTGADTGALDKNGETPADILKREYPSRYEKYIDGLMAEKPEALRLRSEDDNRPAVTGFDFDI